MTPASASLKVGFLIDGHLPRATRPWEWLLGRSSNSAVAQMRFGWIAEHLAKDTEHRLCYEVYRPWQRYDAVVFLKSIKPDCHPLAERLRREGTRVILDVNVDYFTPAEGTFYYKGMAPTAGQTASVRKLAELSDALIADSIHIQRVCARHHARVRWIPDNVNLQLVPPYRAWKRNGKLTLLWSGEAVKLFELLRIEDVLRSFAPHIRLVLVTNDLSAMDRWFAPWKERLVSLLAEIEHEIIPFRSVKELLEVYNSGGVFISPRYLDNTYNWGHTEWKIALPMVCGRVALASPLPSYQEVAQRSAGAGLRLCEDDDSWKAALDSVLSGGFDFQGEESAAREVVRTHYSTEVVARQHGAFVTEVCRANG